MTIDLHQTIVPACLLFLLVLTTPVQAQSIIPATVLRVIDGDTFNAELHLLPDLHRTVRVRPSNLDTPELRGKCPKEKALARKAKQRATELLGARVVLEVPESRAFGVYGRLLARVRLADGRYLAEVLIAEGLGRPYGSGRKSWCG